MEWQDKQNDIDDVLAEDINELAHEVIRLDSDKADKQNENGGFSAGVNSRAGSGAGIGAWSVAYSGCAAGKYAKAEYGGAAGHGAVTSDGFAGGHDAKAADQNGRGIDAVQLGTGTNNTPKTLQVYSKRIVEADGSLTDVGKLSELNTAAKGTVVAAINELKANGGGITDLGRLNAHSREALGAELMTILDAGIYKFEWVEGAESAGEIMKSFLIVMEDIPVCSTQFLIDSYIGMATRTVGMGSDNVPWEPIVSSKKGTSKTGTLLGSGWSAGTQALSVSGLTAEQNGMISVSPSATAAQRTAARKANLSVTGQAAGTLTVTADGAVPEIDIPVTILLF